MLILISCFFCSVAFGQITGEKLAIDLLDQAKISHDNMTNLMKVAKAMDILDIKKERKEISEAEFQRDLGVLIEARKQLHQLAVDQRREISEEKMAAKKKSKKSSVYDLYRERLKKKLDNGQLTQVEYDARMKNVAEREKKDPGL